MPGRSAGKGACEFLHSKFINALVITMNALRNACVKMNAKFIRPGESMAEIIEISRLALHDQVAARLRTWLVEGRIPPGAKLNERALCEQLRVSRTPLREAIKLLASEGLVDLVPNRGAVAVRLGEADVLQTDRKSTRLNSSHQIISYAVFCLKKKKT